MPETLTIQAPPLPAMYDKSLVMYHTYEIDGIGFHPGSQVVTTRSLVERYKWERSLNGGPKKLLTEGEVEKTIGIKERRWAGHGETVTSLAIASSQQALGIEEMGPDEAQAALQRVGLIVFNTSSPERPFPGLAPEFAKELGANRAETYDIRQACASIPFMLKMAIPMLESGMYGDLEALLISSDTLSRITDPSDYHTASLFADAAGTLRLKRSDTKRLAYFELTSAGELSNLLEIPAGQNRLAMNGKALFEEMLRRIPAAVNRFFDHTGMTMSDINFVALHPGSGKMQKSIMDRLKIPADKTLSLLEKFGNPSGASTIGVIKEAYERGKIKEGDKILLAGFGAGVQIGIGVIEWSMPSHELKRRRFHLGRSLFHHGGLTV